jgi:alpha-1,2-mannosyltransferase
MVDRRAGALWALFGGIAAVSSVLVMQRPAGQRLSDLHIYYGAAQTVQAGRPLYEYVAENGGPFTYPPFAVLLLGPMTAFPEAAVRVAWLVLTCAAVAAVAVAVSGAIPTVPRHRQIVVAAVACVVLVSAPAQSNLRFGQVSVFIVLLALVDAVGLTPARYRGVLVGVAAAIKLTPLLFVVFLLLSRRYRDAGRAAGAFVACAVLAAIALPGDSWTYWTGTMLETSRIGNLASLGNQSLHGMLLRVGVAPDALPLLWAALVAIVCGAALVRARRIQLDGEPVRAAVLVGCATVAASPVSWTHHQVWTVLAAMLLIAARGAVRRVAGAGLLVAMVVSLGAVLSEVSTYPGLQFLFENARSIGVVAVCLAGISGVTATATKRQKSRRQNNAAGRRQMSTASRVGLRVATAGAAMLACFAVLPLPAAADPTFKAYTLADAGNPRYFFFCRDRTTCAELARGTAVHFGTARERTKVRVNGVVGDSVARLEYQSAPGGAPRAIPLVEIYPGQRAFSFRSANMANGRLAAYAADGSPLATFTEELP